MLNNTHFIKYSELFFILGHSTSYSTEIYFDTPYCQLPVKLLSHFNLKAKPYNLFGILGFVAGIISFFPLKGDAIDINLHDTYFVIANPSFYALFAIVMLFLWGMYIATGILLSNTLSWLHVLATLLPILIFLLFIAYYQRFPAPPRRYYAFSDFENEKPYFTITVICIVLIPTFIIGQLLFLINIIGGIIKRIKQSRRLNPRFLNTHK